MNTKPLFIWKTRGHRWDYQFITFPKIKSYDIFINVFPVDIIKSFEKSGQIRIDEIGICRYIAATITTDALIDVEGRNIRQSFIIFTNNVFSPGWSDILLSKLRPIYDQINNDRLTIKLETTQSRIDEIVGDFIEKYSIKPSDRLETPAVTSQTTAKSHIATDTNKKNQQLAKTSSGKNEVLISHLTPTPTISNHFDILEGTSQNPEKSHTGTPEPDHKTNQQVSGTPSGKNEVLRSPLEAPTDVTEKPTSVITEKNNISENYSTKTRNLKPIINPIFGAIKSKLSKWKKTNDGYSTIFLMTLVFLAGFIVNEVFHHLRDSRTVDIKPPYSKKDPKL